jgi:hypothetical protein
MRDGTQGRIGGVGALRKCDEAVFSSEIPEIGLLRLSEHCFSRWRQPRYRIALYRRNRYKGRPAFCGGAARSRRLYLLFLLFFAADIVEAKGAIHLDTPVKNESGKGYSPPIYIVLCQNLES